MDDPSQDALRAAEARVAELEAKLEAAVSAVAALEQKYHGVFDESVVAIISFDNTMHITDVNWAAEQLLGYRRDRLLQFSVADVDAEPQDVKPAHNQLLAGDSIVNFEHKLRRGDGRIITVLNNSRPIVDEAGTVQGLQSTLIDISELKAAQDTLRQHQKMEAIGTLAAGVAHDFNNLLTCILGFSELLLLETLSDSVRSGLHEIEHAGEHAAMLTRQLLAFSRQGPEHIEICNLNEVVRGLYGMLRRLVRSNIALEVDVAAAPLWIRADRHNLEQVLLNVVLNAADAVEDETGTIRIRTQLAAPPAEDAASGQTDMATLMVTDNGGGMSEATLSSAFDPFFTTKPTGKGTGLGLATVKGIVERLQGGLSLASTLGQGTEVRVRLPIHPPPPEMDDSAPPVALGARPGETILVVEDNPHSRAAIAAQLRDAGYEVLLAPDALEGLNMALEHDTLSALLADIITPRLRGTELEPRLRAAGKVVPVLLMSGYSAETHGATASEIPFIAKPFGRAILLKAMRSLIDGTLQPG